MHDSCIGSLPADHNRRTKDFLHQTNREHASLLVRKGTDLEQKMSNNAEILVKTILDLKAILDNERVLSEIESALADELPGIAKNRNQELIQDLLLTIDNADAVSTAERVLARSYRPRLVIWENHCA
jgi:hypothetical protein